MRIRNRLYKSFGPFAAASGKFLVVVGAIALYYSWTPLLIIALGAFLGFTQSRITIDVTNKRIRFSEDLFGLIPTGKWLVLNSKMKLDIQHATYSWRVYSQSNRTHDITGLHYRIMLYDAQGFEIMPIKRSGNRETLEKDLDVLCELLQMERLKPAH